MFTPAFVPAINKESLSKLTFLDYEVKEGVTEKTNEVTGEVTEKEYRFFKLEFNCLGKVIGTDQSISISHNLTLDPNEGLGLTLKTLGYSFPENLTKVDDDGFEIEDDNSEDDDDGFGRVESNLFETIEKEIIDFLEALKLKVFTAKVTKNKKGFWVIDTKTLKPFVKSKK